MEAERVVLRKPVQTATVAATPNTAFKRKPIPVAIQPPTPLAPDHDGREAACPHCGATSPRPLENGRSPANDTFAESAQRRVSELEAEVKILTVKATAAADKLADYEDELQKLKTIRARTPSPEPDAAGGNTTSPKPIVETLTAVPEQQEESTPPLPPPPPPTQVQPSRPGGLGRALTTTRITNFLAARRNSPAAQATPAPPANDPGTPSSEPDLGARLLEAENARKAAEAKLTKTNQELDELTASLFEQANNMVSKERKQNAEFQTEAERKAKEREDQWQEWQQQVKSSERAAAARGRKLEDKVKKLEQRVQLLEDREKSKAERLERLEMAVKRATRVRSLIQPAP